jgi:O-antigen ligase
LPLLLDVVGGSPIDIGSRFRFGVFDSGLIIVGVWGGYAFLWRPEGARLLLNAVLIATALIVAEGLIGYVFGLWDGIAGAQSGQPWRLGTVLGGGFDLTGRVIAVGMVAALYFLLAPKAGGPTTIALFVLVAGLPVVLFTLSRGPYIAVALGIFLSLVVLPVRGRRSLAMGLGVVLCALAAVVLGPDIVSFFGGSRPQGLGSLATLNDRVDLWSTFFSPTFYAHPAGLGFGNAQQFVYEQGFTGLYFGANGIQDVTLHSFQLQFLLENGIGGVLILGILLATLTGQGTRLLSGTETAPAEGAVLWVITVILFVTLAIVTLPSLALTMFVFFGVLLGLRYSDVRTTQAVTTVTAPASGEGSSMGMARA